MIKLLFLIFALYPNGQGKKYSINDKPPEHTKEFYLEKSIPQIKKLMENDIQYIAPIMKEAEDQYKAQGLVVPVLFYEDVRALVRKEWSNIEGLLDSVSSESEKRNYSSLAVEVYGFHHMVDRIKEEREENPLLPTYEKEMDLKSRLMEIQSNTTNVLKFVINKSKGNGELFLEKFHQKLIDWIEPEFTKLNQVIETLPTSEERVANMKVWFEDLVLAQTPPF